MLFSRLTSVSQFSIVFLSPLLQDSKGMQVVKLCTDKILQLLLGVPADTG